MVTTINTPTEQDVDLSTVGDRGEINIVHVHGVQTGALSYPGDVFAHATRVLVDDQSEGTHSQRVGAAAFEAEVTGGEGHERNVVGVEASAKGGTTNTALLALAGDIAANAGDIYTNAGNMSAAGYLAGQVVYSRAGAIHLQHTGGWVVLRAYAEPPIDWQPGGTLALVAAPPGLWLSLGDAGWQRFATVP